MQASWADTWMAVAQAMAKRSRCDGRAIGAVIVSPDQRVVSTGYNGAPSRFPEPYFEVTCSTFCPRMQPGGERTQGYDNCVSVHAEANALLHASGRDVRGGTLYVTSACCYSCAKLVAAAGISHVEMVVSNNDAHRRPDETVAFLEKCGLTVKVIRG